MPGQVEKAPGNSGQMGSYTVLQILHIPCKKIQRMGNLLQARLSSQYRQRKVPEHHPVLMRSVLCKASHRPLIQRYGQDSTDKCHPNDPMANCPGLEDHQNSMPINIHQDKESEFLK